MKKEQWTASQEDGYKIKYKILLNYFSPEII